MCDKVAKLFPLVVKVVKVLIGVPKEVAELNEELHRVEGCINVADRMAASAGQGNQDEDGIKKMVKDLREATLRIEEVTDDYMITEQQQNPHDHGCIAVLYAASNFIKNMIIRLRISYEIEDIKSSVVELEERSKISGLKIQSTSCSSVKWHSLREEAWYIKEDKIVGFEAPTKKLMGWLLGNKEKRLELAVICVVGMGGRGKTTLAKTAYDKVIGEFDCGAYITVSPVYTVEDLLRNILNKMCERRNETPPKDISQMDRKTLTDKVSNYLKKKRYVLLFDDVWNHEFWNEIRFALYDDNNKSRIIITTRNMNVADFCNESSILYVHNLQPLSKQQSLDLFTKKAFKNGCDEDFMKEVKEISSKIVEKCEGLPLAIVAVGGLLSKKNDFSEWQDVYQTLISTLDMNPNSTGITNIIGLSYNDLPYHLKSCFLYFGIYPEDYEVGPKRLIRQWIAEGFVKPVPRSLKTLDKVGEQHLKELVDRNLVQVSSFSIDGKPKGCRVHDLLRDMILTKIEDISFCHFASDAEGDRSMLSWKIRRLQIATKSNDHLKDTSIEGSLIRSLYTFRRKKLPEGLVKIIPTKCKRLKIFDFEDNWVKYIPENFGCLIQLRYLSFRNTKVRNIPESIGNLLNLETLDLRGTFVSKLPKEINQLRKLQHLLYKHNISWNDGVKMMGGFAGLESLHTLHKVETSHNGGELTKELERFMQLRCLGLVNVKPEYISPLYSSIEKIQYLEKLYISVSEDEGSIDWDCINSPLPMLQKLSLIGRLERFPKWIAKQESLVKLTLWYSNLTEDPLKVLSSLPKLVSLSLSSAYRGETLHFQNGGFQKLKRLVLKSLSSLNSIHINEGALPLLKELVLKHIPELSKIPSGINHLNKLEVFDIIGTRFLCSGVGEFP
ncbi:hypothetical protein TanjilG_02531 [Lupinus angustifolius]|uniref:NB-ARC domain-containing protein n=1 Tax=Lupinus angustifolius TaxID=3871 RepID=A0A394DDP9_LUPAN|nr:hypothetical protein TanjilG_02531 [Lupinus angustifolius]